jgi:chorismate synthase
MTRMMFGPLVLLAASVSPLAQPAAPAGERMPIFQPSSGATAQATARIRVISGVKFGAGHAAATAGAEHRQDMITDADGQMRPAEMLEFQ